MVYHKSLKLATASQFVSSHGQALKNVSVEEERPLFNAAIQVVDQSSASVSVCLHLCQHFVSRVDL